jgi:hypothetical protein
LVRQQADCLSSVQKGPEFHDDDGAVVYGPLAIQAALQWGLRMREERRRILEAMTPLERHRYARRLAIGRPLTTHRLATVTVLRARAREHRPRATRRTSSSSRTSGVDPGETDPAHCNHGWRACLTVGREQVGDDVCLYFADDANAAHPGDGRMEPQG